MYSHGLARIIHIFEDNKSLICYKHVVETVFEAANEASECLTIAQHSVCCSFGTPLALIKPGYYGLVKNSWEQQTLCCPLVRHSDASFAASNTVSTTCL